MKADTRLGYKGNTLGEYLTLSISCMPKEINKKIILTISHHSGEIHTFITDSSVNLPEVYVSLTNHSS